MYIYMVYILIHLKKRLKLLKGLFLATRTKEPIQTTLNKTSTTSLVQGCLCWFCLPVDVLLPDFFGDGKHCIEC